MTFDIKAYRDQHRSFYRSDSLRDVAQDLYDRFGGAEKHKDVDSWARAKGFAKDLEAEDQQFKEVKEKESTVQEVEDIWQRNSFLSGLRGGLIKTYGTFQGAMALGADTIGADEFRDKMISEYQQTMEEASKYASDTSFKDLTEDFSFSGALEWGAHTMGDLLPSMAVGILSAGTGTAVAIAGRKGLEKAAGKFVGFAVRRQMAKGLSERAAKAAVTRGIARGAGVVMSTSVMEAGSMYGDVATELSGEKANPFKAGVLGVASGLVEIVGGNMRLVNKVFGTEGSKALKSAIELAKRNPRARSHAMQVIGNIGKAIAKQAPEEFGQEAFQEALSIGNEYWQDAEVDAVLSEKNFWRVLEAGMAGALGGTAGGAFGGVMDITQKETSAKVSSDIANLQVLIKNQEEILSTPNGESLYKGIRERYEENKANLEKLKERRKVLLADELASDIPLNQTETASEDKGEGASGGEVVPTGREEEDRQITFEDAKKVWEDNSSSQIPDDNQLRKMLKNGSLSGTKKEGQWATVSKNSIFDLLERREVKASATAIPTIPVKNEDGSVSEVSPEEADSEAVSTENFDSFYSEHGEDILRDAKYRETMKAERDPEVTKRVENTIKQTEDELSQRAEEVRQARRKAGEALEKKNKGTAESPAEKDPDAEYKKFDSFYEKQEDAFEENFDRLLFEHMEQVKEARFRKTEEGVKAYSRYSFDLPKMVDAATKFIKNKTARKEAVDEMRQQKAIFAALGEHLKIVRDEDAARIHELSAAHRNKLRSAKTPLERNRAANEFLKGMRKLYAERKKILAETRARENQIIEDIFGEGREHLAQIPSELDRLEKTVGFELLEIRKEVRHQNEMLQRIRIAANSNGDIVSRKKAEAIIKDGFILSNTLNGGQKLDNSPLSEKQKSDIAYALLDFFLYYGLDFQRDADGKIVFGKKKDGGKTVKVIRRKGIRGKILKDLGLLVDEGFVGPAIGRAFIGGKTRIVSSGAIAGLPIPIYHTIYDRAASMKNWSFWLSNNKGFMQFVRDEGVPAQYGDYSESRFRQERRAKGERVNTKVDKELWKERKQKWASFLQRDFSFGKLKNSVIDVFATMMNKQNIRDTKQFVKDKMVYSLDPEEAAATYRPAPGEPIVGGIDKKVADEMRQKYQEVLSGLKEIRNKAKEKVASDFKRIQKLTTGKSTDVEADIRWLKNRIGKILRTFGYDISGKNFSNEDSGPAYTESDRLEAVRKIERLNLPLPFESLAKMSRDEFDEWASIKMDTGTLSVDIDNQGFDVHREIVRAALLSGYNVSPATAVDYPQLHKFLQSGKYDVNPNETLPSLYGKRKRLLEEAEERTKVLPKLEGVSEEDGEGTSWVNLWELTQEEYEQVIDEKLASGTIPTEILNLEQDIIALHEDFVTIGLIKDPDSVPEKVRAEYPEIVAWHNRITDAIERRQARNEKRAEQATGYVHKNHGAGVKEYHSTLGAEDVAIFDVVRLENGKIYKIDKEKTDKDGEIFFDLHPVVSGGSPQVLPAGTPVIVEPVFRYIRKGGTKTMENFLERQFEKIKYEEMSAHYRRVNKQVLDTPVFFGKNELTGETVFYVFEHPDSNMFSVYRVEEEMTDEEVKFLVAKVKQHTATGSTSLEAVDLASKELQEAKMQDVDLSFAAAAAYHEHVVAAVARGEEFGISISSQEDFKNLSSEQGTLEEHELGTAALEDFAVGSEIELLGSMSKEELQEIKETNPELYQRFVEYKNFVENSINEYQKAERQRRIGKRAEEQRRGERRFEIPAKNIYFEKVEDPTTKETKTKIRPAPSFEYVTKNEPLVPPAEDLSHVGSGTIRGVVKMFHPDPVDMTGKKGRAPFTYDGKKYLNVEHAFQSLVHGFKEEVYSHAAWTEGQSAALTNKEGEPIKPTLPLKSQKGLIKSLLKAYYEQNESLADGLLKTGNRPFEVKSGKTLFEDLLLEALPEIRAEMRGEDYSLVEEFIEQHFDLDFNLQNIEKKESGEVEFTYLIFDPAQEKPLTGEALEEHLEEQRQRNLSRSFKGRTGEFYHYTHSSEESEVTEQISLEDLARIPNEQIVSIRRQGGGRKPIVTVREDAGVVEYTVLEELGGQEHNIVTEEESRRIGRFIADQYGMRMVPEDAVIQPLPSNIDLGAVQSRVDGWKKKLAMATGVEIVVHESIHSETAPVFVRLQALEKPPRRFYGFFQPGQQDRIHIFADMHVAANGTIDGKEMFRTFLHEVVHYGIGVLAPSGMAKKDFLDKVYSNFKEEINPDRLRISEFDRHKATEEWIASVIEDVEISDSRATFRNQQIGSYFDELVGWIRELVRKVGIDLDLSKAEIRNILAKSYRGFNEFEKTIVGGAIPKQLRAGSGVMGFGSKDLYVESAADIFLRRIVDKHRDIELFMQAARRSKLSISERTNVLSALRVMPGKVSARIDLVEHERTELENFLKKNKIDIDVLGKFLQARHAFERNRAVRKKTGEEKHHGGMSDRLAMATLTDLRRQGLVDFSSLASTQPTYSGKLAEAAAIVDNINKQFLDAAVEYGEISAGERKRMEATYKFHVPFDTDETIKSDSYVLGANRRVIKGVAQQDDLSQNPAVISLIRLMKLIARGEKNHVNQRLFRFVASHPHPLFKLYRSPDNGAMNAEDFNMGKDEFEDFLKRQKIEDASDEVVMKANNEIANNNIVPVRFAGQDYYIQVDKPGIFKSLHSFGPETTGTIMRSLYMLNRMLTYVNTVFNPEFLFPNAVRDLGTAAANLGIGHDIGGSTPQEFMKRVVKGTPKAIWGITRHNFPQLRGQNMSHDLLEQTYLELYKRFAKAGGKVGLPFVGNPEVLAKEMKVAVSGMKSGALPYALSEGKKLRNMIFDLNDAFENGVRFSAFMEGISAGLTEEQAANLARDLTVDFNRRGEWGTLINSLYLFSNAGIQGTYRILRAIKSNPKAAGVLVSSMIGGAFTLAIANRLWGGEDDDGRLWYEKVSKDIRGTHMVLMMPFSEGSHLKVPLPYGFGFFYNVGEQMASMVFGETDAVETGANILDNLLHNFNPLGAGGNLNSAHGILRTLAPTVLDIPLDIAYETNAFGTPLMPEASFHGQPDAMRFWNSVNPVSRKLSERLNSLTGGSATSSGYIDISPETVEHLIGELFGGTGRIFSRTINLTESKMKGNDVKWNDYPIVRRFVGEPFGFEDARLFEENIKFVRATRSQHRELEKRLRWAKTPEAKRQAQEELKSFFSEKKEELRLYKRSNEFYRIVTDLRSRKASISSSGIDNKKTRDLLNRIDKRILTLMKEFNKRFSEVYD